MQTTAIEPNYTTEEDLWELSHEGCSFEIWDGELKSMVSVVANMAFGLRHYPLKRGYSFTETI